MLLYTTIGTNDLARASTFWAPIMASLGHPSLPDLGENWLGWGVEGETGFAYYIGLPFDGASASAGNGGSFAFPARDAAHVRVLHALALHNGGQDAGPPGPREGYPPDYYVAYVRDPDGHKLAFVAHYADPSEGVTTTAPATPGHEDHYPPRMIAMLEAVWGTGFLSPGGPEEVARVIGTHDLRGKSVLDIGCGAGGIDIALVRNHGAAHVCGLDVEDPVLTHARALIAREGLTDQIGLVKAAPGPLPFPPATFDVVFSKDSIVHIPDKHALMAEVFRVLKPGGWFLASDWLITTEEVSPLMAEYIAAEGLDFGMATPQRYLDAMASAGFKDGTTTSRNAWYRVRAREELDRLKGEAGVAAARIVGQAFVDHNIGIWSRIIPVLDSGEHSPTHLAARKPG
jgi:SAM-dependent methyltransferase